jgi:hypothetical protein
MKIFGCPQPPQMLVVMLKETLKTENSSVDY